jgi:hypothetical protein
MRRTTPEYPEYVIDVQGGPYGITNGEHTDLTVCIIHVAALFNIQRELRTPETE